MAVSEEPLEPAEKRLERELARRGPKIVAAVESGDAYREAFAEADARGRAEAEVSRKRQEIAAQTVQIQELTSTAARLARAIDEVAGFKREAIEILGGRIARAGDARAEAERELAILRADLEKKTAELLAMDELRARLENDLDNLRHEVQRLRERLRSSS